MNFVLEAEIWAHFGVFEVSSRGSKIVDFRLISWRLELNSKIASVAQNLVPWGPTMPNLGSLVCSVWAVGEGWFENAAAHLIFGGNLYTNSNYIPVALLIP